MSDRLSTLSSLPAIILTMRKEFEELPADDDLAQALLDAIKSRFSLQYTEICVKAAFFDVRFKDLSFLSTEEYNLLCEAIVHECVAVHRKTGLLFHWELEVKLTGT